MNKLIVHIHKHVFASSQDSSVWLRLTRRQILMSPRCLVLPKCLCCGERTKNILFSSVSSRVLSEKIQSVHPETRVSSFPGPISVARVN